MLALTAVTALAQGQGVNLSWGPDCASDALIVNKNFACTSNAGSSTMVASFVPTASHERLLSLEATIVAQTCFDQVISDWWQFKNVGACRLASLSSNVAYPATAVNCRDAWAGQGIQLVAYDGDPVRGYLPPYVQGIRARIKVGCAVSPEQASAVEGGFEYFAFNLVVNHAKTVGSESCAGCVDPVWWWFEVATVGYLDAGVYSEERIGWPTINQMISWQGGWSECVPVATRNKTWGQIKGLYR
jgi:hypothetical protein